MTPEISLSIAPRIEEHVPPADADYWEETERDLCQNEKILLEIKKCVDRISRFAQEIFNKTCTRQDIDLCVYRVTSQICHARGAMNNFMILADLGSENANQLVDLLRKTMKELDRCHY